MPPTPDNRVHVVYGSALLIPSGRVADSAIMKALGWEPGTPIQVRAVLPGVLAADGVAGSDRAVAANGHLPIPAAVRRKAGLRVGDRVLLAAHPHQNRLIIVCQVALDGLLGDIRALIDGGEPR